MAGIPFDFDQPCDPPLEIVGVTPTGEHQLPPGVSERIAIYTPHDGGAIPARFYFRPDGVTPRVEPTRLVEQHVSMRDWGANLVAEELARTLGLASYARCKLARVLLDFNRFPGRTAVDGGEPLETLAIGRIFANVLRHDEATALLESYYDPISEGIEAFFADSLVGIAIHTYDETHASRTKRADLSIISLPLSYQRDARLTYGVFDPMYPDHLAESTCSRILRDRISLNLERSGFRVTHNHPYPIPDGGIEMRAQVWHFFRFLQQQFSKDHPDTIGRPDYETVWTMLLDTNLRLAEADALRGYIHRFRRVRPDERAPFQAALEAYQHIQRYLETSDAVTDFRRSPDRPSSLGIEIRKDLLCSFDPETGIPKRPDAEQLETARHIARAIAGAIATYIDTDRRVYEEVGRDKPLAPLPR
ncbi:MAG: N-formylglutamate amidohydrolase [Sandaracinaceae bacterium]|nr:N-formylglutamate amidohydrolase [Sandaracinaceae bacterium]